MAGLILVVIGLLVVYLLVKWCCELLEILLREPEDSGRDRGQYRYRRSTQK